MNSISDRNRLERRWVSIVLVAVLCSYPLLGTLNLLTSWPSLAASIPARALVALPSVALLLRPRDPKLPWPVFALWTFWVIYLIRLMWDTFIVGLTGADQALLFFVATCLLPGAALLRAHALGFDEIEIARLILWFGVTTSTLAITFFAFDLAVDHSLFADTGRLGFDTVNPITYGHLAASTVLAAIVLWHRVGGKVSLIMLVLASVVSATILQMSGSRGPALSLAICLLLLTVFQRRLRLLVLIFIVLATALAINGSSSLSERIVNIDADVSTQDRVVVQSNAINQFLDSPLVGSAYIERELQMYPHNPIIEAAMATGVPGLFLFCLILITVAGRILRLLRQGHILLPLLTVQYLAAAMVSGALYLSTSMWVLFSLVLVITDSNRGMANFHALHPVR